MGCAKETTSEKLRKEAERKRIYRAKQKAKKEAASNSTQAETSNAQTPTPSSTASIYEPTAFPLTPLNPVSAERNDQLPTSSLISSSFKKRPRGMNPEELKQHNRERTKLWRAKRAATEAASNSTQAKTSNAQPPTPSSTAPIVEPTPAPSTPVTPAPAESYAQLPTSSSMNSLDASSTDKFETISGKPSKKRLKDMNPEERKQYNREKSALSRAKKAATGIDKMLNVAVSDSCAAPLSSTDNVSLNSLGFDGTSAENDIGTTEEPTTKRWRDMNATERKEYKRLNKKTCRAKKAASCVDHDAVSLRSLDTDASDSHSVAASTSTRASNKRRNSQTPAESRKCDAKRRADLYADITALLDNHEEEINFPGDESTTEAGNMNMTSCMPEKTVPVIKPPQSSERPSVDSKKDCKIRIGLIDLFDVEAQAIVVPQYDSVEQSKHLATAMSILHKHYPKRLKQFVEDYNDPENMKKRNNFGAVTFDWQEGRTKPIRQLDKYSIHVEAPIVKRNNFTVITEAHLRAAYLSCLMEAERNQFHSLAFPLLGLNCCPERSAAIALQTIFAYMHAVKGTCLKLIYITTRDVKVYDQLGKYFAYVREFDLNKWSTKDYLCYEHKIFNKIKGEEHFATIPGTDIVWRAIKVSHDRGMAKSNKEVLEDMHRKMTAQTGIRATMFRIQQRKNGGLRMAEEFIENGFNENSSTAHHNLLDIRFSMEQFCGSNEVLRKLWIYSYYRMYFQEHFGDEVDVDKTSQQYKTRKAVFKQQKQVHAEVIKMWNDTIDHAPFKCKCTLEGGRHEKMMVFLTRLSHPDFVFDEWILGTRSFVFNHEVSEQFLKEIPLCEATFVYRDSRQHAKAALVQNKEELQRKIENQVSSWLIAKPEAFALQHELLLNLLDEHHDITSNPVGGETHPKSYDPASFDKNIDESPEMQKPLNEVEEASEQMSVAFDSQEHRKAVELLQRRIRALDANRYVIHLNKDIEIERTIRNRIFRNESPFLVCSPAYPDYRVNYGTDEDEKNDEYTEDCMLWMDGDAFCTVDEYIRRKTKQRQMPVYYVPSEIQPYNPYESVTVNLDFPTTTPEDADPNKDEATPQKPTNPDNSSKVPAAPVPSEPRDTYPQGIDIGDMEEACPHCGAFSFAGERSWSCCKSGAVWIPPKKRIPEEIRQMFERKYRNHLISANAAFSMASIRYNREPQKQGGVQSLKIKGMVSCHPSAVHPHNPNNMAYANFIVMNESSEEIAVARYKTLKQAYKKDLKQIFVEIQKYMEANNRLYESYKTMAQIEEEFKETADFVKNSSINFRIVSPGELSKKDLKELEAHNGCYARPSRMGKGYITVAFTWNADLTTPIPRGMVIYPKNPKDKPQEPLSIYSELCDLMSYPLFYPDAVGGWGLHKYARVDPKHKLATDFSERVKAHLAELKENKEDPNAYYELDDTEIEKAVEAAFNKKMPKSKKNQPENSIAVSDDDDEQCGYKMEEDAKDFDLEEQLEYAELEDREAAPLDANVVGQEPNLKTVERRGEVYTMVDREQRTRDIPYTVDAIPFMENSSDDGSEAPDIDRFRTYDDDYFDFDELEKTQVEQQKKQSGADDEKSEEELEEDEYEHFEGAKVDHMADMDELGDDIEVAEGAERHEEEMADLDEDVHYGDENNAERTALGEHNDGVRVKNVGSRKHVSLAEFAKFVIQSRRGIPCRFQGKARTLGQLYLIDMACRVNEMRMSALTVKRAEFPEKVNRSLLMKMYAKMLDDKFKGKKKLGMLVTMPSTFPGSSKYQRELVMKAITISNELGNPHLFITFTGNPKWPEIVRACQARQCEWADIPEIVNRVFKRKYELFLDDILGKKKKDCKRNGKYFRESGIFGPVVWYNYSVEFQQRGMPHCHLLVCLKNPITNAAQVDEIISAEVPDLPDESDPDKEKKLDYYTLVRDLMVHTPCEDDDSAYCKEGMQPHWKQCGKGFPKKLCDHTILSDNQYPDYKRTNKNHFKMIRKGRSYNVGSEYVVAHNRELLMKYRCHMNIEIVSSIKTMKYMFKYIHKGSDRVLLEATEKMARGTFAPDSMTLDRNVFVPRNLDVAKVIQRQKEADRLMNQAGVLGRFDERVALNDCSYMMDMSAMTACEAAWRISGFPMHGSSHIVHRGYIHEENKDVMYTNRGVSAAQAGEMLKLPSKGMMTAWFEANQNPDKLPDNRLTTDLTLPEMFAYYIFDVKLQKFILRGKDYSHRTLGRIQAPQPRWLELTATWHLVKTVKGPKSWEELRTFRGTTYDTCLETARARGLMNGDIEWHCALDEVAKSENPLECRRFFVSILVHCAPANPKELWEAHRHQLVNTAQSWSEARKTAHALRHIEYLLARHGMALSDFELGSIYNPQDVPAPKKGEDLDDPNNVPLTPEKHKMEGKKLFEALNEGQLKFVKRALELSKKKNQKRLLFVDGPGGTGKTYCYKTIYHKLCGKGMKVACVSHTGIAACLLPNGCTAHRKFSIPLEVFADMAAKISLGLAEGDALAELDCLIWDEISMTDHRIIHAVNIVLQRLKNSTLPFGGVLVIMGGDWRQILPIVEGARGQAVAQYTLKMYQEWKNFEKFKLTENQRAKDDPVYAERILKIGDGTHYANEKRQMVFIPEANIERRSDRALAEWVFPNVDDISSTKSAALLTVDNKTALRLNEQILDRLSGELHEFCSLDTADKDNGLNVDPAVFASETPSGMPPHKLRLKVGAQVILLRNLSVESGLCNGTRLTIDRFGDDIIHCTVNNPTGRSAKTVWLHRMLLSPTGKGAKSCGFKRLQYPLRLAYASTINKSQGQTLSRCGLVLHTPVFSHGQLYVAMSRVKNGSDFKLWHTRRVHTPGDDQIPGGGMLVRNVVFKDVLRDEQVKEILESLEPRLEKDNEDTASIASAPSVSSSRISSGGSSNGESREQSVSAFFSRLKTTLTETVTETVTKLTSRKRPNNQSLPETSVETETTTPITPQSGNNLLKPIRPAPPPPSRPTRSTAPKGAKRSKHAEKLVPLKRSELGKSLQNKNDEHCFLRLENPENALNCSVNVLVNILYCIEPFRLRLLENRENLNGVTRLLADLFSRDITRSTTDLRQALREDLREGMADINDLFHVFIEKMLLSGEDGEEFRAVVNRNTICLTDGCIVSAGYDFPEEFYSTTLLMPANNASFLNMINDSSSDMSRCEKCGMDGKKMTMRLIESTSDYHFVTVERTGNRKLDSYMNADTRVQMHGAWWNLVAFAELEYGHYKVWVKAKETWICVSDLQVNSEKPHNSIEMQKFGLNLMLFKKVAIIDVNVDADQNVHLGNKKEPEANGAAEFSEDYKKRVGQRFPLLAEDGPCLQLKNYGNDCFVNSIANILFSCSGIRKTIRSCTDSSKPLALILGKIFRREVENAVELRRTLPVKYHTRQHDITDVFELFIEALVEEGNDFEHLFTERRLRECSDCGNVEESTPEVLQNFASLTLPQDDIFQVVFNNKYEDHFIKKKCPKCGKRNVWENVQVQHQGKYLFVRVWQNGASFSEFSTNSVVRMFGSKWKLNGFTEYTTVSGVKGGHYEAWVRGNQLWYRINDRTVDDTQNDVKLEGRGLSILVFEKTVNQGEEEEEVISNEDNRKGIKKNYDNKVNVVRIQSKGAHESDETKPKPGIFKRLETAFAGMFIRIPKTKKPNKSETLQTSSERKSRKKIDKGITEHFDPLIIFNINQAPRYDGSSSFIKWVERFSHFLKGRERNEYEGLQMMPWLLSAEASRVYQDLPERLRVCGPWDELVDRFHKAIYPEHVRKLAQQELQELRDSERGVLPVNQLFEKLENAVEKFLPGTSTIMKDGRDRLLKELFIECLPDKMVRNMLQEAIPSVRKTWSGAEQKEAILQMCYNNSYPSAAKALEAERNNFHPVNSYNTPPRYDGSTSFIKWVDEFNHFLKSEGRNEYEGLPMLFMLFSAEASKVYEGLPERLRACGPWDELVDQFHKALYPEHVRMLAKQELQELTNSGVGVLSLDELFERLENAVEKALPGMSASTTNARDRLLKELFIRCLPDETVRDMLREAIPSVRETLREARREESILVMCFPQSYPSIAKALEAERNNFYPANSCNTLPPLTPPLCQSQIRWTEADYYHNTFGCRLMTCPFQGAKRFQSS